MEGLYFLLSIIGMFAIVRWAIRNDGVGADQETTGLLAMTPELKVSAEPNSQARKVRCGRV